MIKTLAGTIPRELGNLYILQKLLLDYSKLRGLIPIDALANYKDLMHLKVNNDPLNGILLDSVGNLSSSIQAFEVSNCKIKGNIPDAIGNLRGLVVLNLRRDGLFGSMPSSIKFLQKHKF